ncbi:hypothetical protein DFJ77DRAFT_62328 [Powellomyces hirtus]|nr:hypothetical protein DFJ77DRAFT_62328 [Powellomyces hirtus]
MSPKRAKQPNGVPSKHSTQPGTSEHEPLLDLSEDEQWRIVNETGLLHKLTSESRPTVPGGGQSYGGPTFSEDYLFQAILLTIPLTTLHGFLEYVVHFQFGFLNEFTVAHVLTRQVPLAPALALFIYLTSRVKHMLVVQVAFLVLSVVCGCMLIYLSADEPAFGEMLRTPGLAVLWIYFVIQMRLGVAVVSLVATLLYYHRDWFRFGGEMKRGFSEL